MHGHRILGGLLIGGLAALAAGCGGSNDVALVPVEGTVTLNGEPLVGAEVLFRPEGKGRPSAARTDLDGHYRLLYTDEQWGAVPAKHKVSITTRIEPDSDSDDEFKQKGRKELLPANYNQKTTLEADLTAGSQEPIDFRLETKTSGS